MCLDKRSQEITIDQEFADLGWCLHKFWVGSGGTITYNCENNLDKSQRWNFATAFRQIIQQAKDENVKRLFFLEDDAKLTPKFNEVYPYIISEIRHVDFDMLYFGGKFDDPQCTYSEQLTGHIFHKNYILDLHAVLIDNRCFDKLLDIPPHDHQSFDGFIAGRHRINIRALITSPIIIAQKNGWSYSAGRYLDFFKDYL